MVSPVVLMYVHAVGKMSDALKRLRLFFFFAVSNYYIHEVED